MKAIHTFLVLSMLTTGCVPGKKYQPPKNPDGTHKIDLLYEEPKYRSAEPILVWWKEFNDPQLSTLVEMSLHNNKDIRIALANLFEARAASGGAKFDYLPTITANASYTRQRLSEEGVQGAPADRTINNYHAGFDALWELDLFGRVSERVASYKAIEESALADLQYIYVTVAAEVAASYMELRGTQYRLNIAERNAKNQEETYNLVRKLQAGGRLSELDALRAHAQLELTRSTVPSLQAKVTAVMNRLSILTGQIPDTLHKKLAEVKSLPSLPNSVAVGNATDLLKRRSDVRAAERRLAAQVAQYNIAVTEIFPIVNIVGAIGFSATNINNFGPSALAGMVGPSISWNIFDLGHVRARINQADARSQAALARYEKVVLQALEEVQTALSNFTREEKRRATLQNAAYSASRSTKLSKQRFSQGMDSMLDILDVERIQLQAEDMLAESEIKSALYLIAIYKALSGSWSIE